MEDSQRKFEILGEWTFGKSLENRGKIFGLQGSGTRLLETLLGLLGRAMQEKGAEPFDREG